jgi:hypothetical protein
MAATKRNAMLVEGTRERVQVTQLVKRLQNHGLGKLKKPLDPSQVKAIEILLRKTLPDLSATTLSGQLDIHQHEQALSELD